MRMVQSILATGVLTLTSFAAAQQEPYTDVRLDQLAGPVRSTVTSTSYPDTEVRLPDGPVIVLPIMRRRCEYDPDGYKTLGETPQQGGPYGEMLQLSRDPQGHLYERRTLDRQSGRMVRYERFGTYGAIEDRRYGPDGKLTDEFLQSWDENGHRSLFVAKDGSGKEFSRRRTRFTIDGVLTEDSSWGANGLLEWTETYDPATDVSQFRNYDKNGTLRLSRTSVHDRVTSFWASEENLYGSSVGWSSELHEDVSMCHADGTCNHLVYEYSRQDKRDPRSVELRDAAGTLKVGAYFEYVLDAHGNWTNRVVHVRLNDKPLTLYEEDARALVYWPAP